MKDEIEKILERLTAPSKSGIVYDARTACMIWVACDYSKSDLVNDLRKALNGERNTQEAE